MSKEKHHAIPACDPVSGGPLVISELTAPESGVTIRGTFDIPRYARLDAEQAHFLETFLRCRGVLSTMEGELGMSYPTLRSRLDALLEALDLAPVKETAARKTKSSDRQKILDQLERGEISAAEAKSKLKGGNAK
ncbi:MAG: DUF2089 domain-containing protein [Fimbriimonadaceae bacterium]|nr:DUF2089 domain-containing protein [Fimbriimonadaceae bacterium]